MRKGTVFSPDQSRVFKIERTLIQGGEVNERCRIAPRFLSMTQLVLHKAPGANVENRV